MFFKKIIIKGKWEMYVCSKYYLLKILIILFYIWFEVFIVCVVNLIFI